MTDACATPGLLSVDDALARLLSSAKAVTETETVSLNDALGRVLAVDITSRVDVPPADNSAMDGFAFCLADLQAAAGYRLPVSQRIPAGSVPQPLTAKTAARIFTGAEIPPGADVVVMQENCVYDSNEVTVNAATVAEMTAGENLRPRGQDMRAGDVVASIGTRLGPAHIGVIAGAGHARVDVMRRVRAAIFSTGDELLEPGDTPQPGRIFNSNRYALRSLLTTMGCDVIDLGCIPDRRDATESALRDAAKRADIVITTGGASVGEEDHLVPALKTVGRVDLWKIAVKPGKPLLHGFIADTGREVPVVGLPGNPVSVHVTFLIFVAPFLKRLQGDRAGLQQPLWVPSGFAIRKPSNRTEFLRVRLQDGKLERFPNQSSGVLTSVAWAEGLARIPAGTTIDPNQGVAYFPLALLT